MSFERQYLKKGICKGDKLIKWTAISLWRIDSTLILKGQKNSEWPPCPIWNCSISPSPRQILLSHTAVPMLPASSLSYCDGLPDLTSIEFFALSIKFHFPVADTRPCPSTTAGNNQGQLGLHLTAPHLQSFSRPPSPSRLGVPEQQPSRIKSRIIGRSFACTVWEEVRACLREALHATSSDRGARRHVSRLWHIQEFLPGCPILAYC